MMIMGRQYQGHKATKIVKIKKATDGVNFEEVITSMRLYSTTPQWKEFVRSVGLRLLGKNLHTNSIFFFYKYRCIVFNKFYLLFFVSYQ